MNDLFLNDKHLDRYLELSKGEELDSYWRSLLYIISGNEQLYQSMEKLVDFEDRSIKPEFWFNGPLSSGETKLLGLAFNLFTDMDYYPDEEKDTKYYISPLEIFSGLDAANYELGINAIAVRLKNLKLTK